MVDNVIRDAPLDPRLSEINPRTLENFSIDLITYNGNVVEITPTVTEVSIYESIHSPFLYGEVIIIDNSAILSVLPIIGQERIRVSFTRQGDDFEKIFYVTDLFDVKQALENVGSYGISISTKKQMINSISLFSKSYRGNASQIINDIHTEFFDEELEIISEGKTSHNIVFPYIKPLQAINMIQKNVLAVDDSPLFMFETLYDKTTKLISYKDMYEQEIVAELKPFKPTNTFKNDDGTYWSETDFQGHVYEWSITKAYDTLTALSKGSFGSKATVIDISAKSATINDFDFRQHAPPIANDYISDYFGMPDSKNGLTRVNNIRTTRNVYVPQNKFAFNSDFPNLNGVNSLDRSKLNSYMNRLNTTSVYLSMDSDTRLSAGLTVDLTLSRFSPKLQESENTEDYVNSGKYVISSIRHYIKNLKYTMSVDLIRDGMGENAELYPNGDVPDFSAPIRENKNVINTFDESKDLEEIIIERSRRRNRRGGPR